MKVGNTKIAKQQVRPAKDIGRSVAKAAAVKGPLAKGTKGLKALPKLGGYK